MKKEFLIFLTLIAILIPSCANTQLEPIETNKTKVKTPSISIHQAAYKGDAETIIQHYKSGTNIDLKNQWNATPLHYAARSGKLDSVKTLISKGANVNAKNNNNVTPLHFAASGGSPEISLLLLKNKANVNEQDSEGLTPIHRAAQTGQIDIIEMLIKNGADVNTKNGAGLTPLELAEPATAKLLKKYGAKSAVKLGLLSEDAAKGNIDAINKHLSSGSDVNGKTP